MGGYGYRLAVFAAFGALAALMPATTEVQAAPASAVMHRAPADAVTASLLQHVGVHRRRVQSFYCYPRKWWFYRPYTTDPQNHERCMPYFHYLGPGYGRGAKGGGYPK